ncbi:MAG: hypothetical protein WCO44_02120 [Bacteroidota bacterium]
MKTSIKIIHWAPRILCILAILLISMFALDAFDERRTIWQQLEAFAIHLIPTYVLVLFLVIAWKWELIGGSILIILALGLTPFIYSHNYNMNHSVGWSLFIIMMINFPFILTGGLFIISHFMKLKNRPAAL